MSTQARVVRAIQAARRRRPRITDRDHSGVGVGKVALVTGASAGIGRAYAELLAAKGFRVVVVARREQKLKELKAELETRWGATVDVIPCDLTAEDAVATIVDTLARLQLRVDYLVNNAGFSVGGRFLDKPWSQHQSVVQAMAIVPAQLCHELMPHMVEQRWGRIVNVGSVAALYAGSPQMVMYSPVKSFLVKFTEGLAEEYEHQGVHVIASIPGVTETEFFDANGMGSHAESLKVQLPMMLAETVARQGYEACERKHRVIVHGWHHKVFMFFAVHLPPRLRYSFVRVVTLTGLHFD